MVTDILRELIEGLISENVLPKDLAKHGVPKHACHRLTGGVYRGKGVISTIEAAGRALGWNLVWVKGDGPTVLQSGE